MTHLTPLQFSMFADGALTQSEQADADVHLQDCEQCQQALAQFRAESRLISHAMQATPESFVQLQADTPKFKRPLTFRSFALANLGTGLVIWLAQFLWKTIFGELVMNATAWATSIFLPDTYALASTTFLYLLEEGTAMFDAYLGLIILTLVAAGLLGAVLFYGKRLRHNTSVMAGLLVASVGLSALPAQVEALEIRRDSDVVTISSDENIDDSVIMAGDTILIEGNVSGDVVAAGRRIEVSGDVGGNLVAFAEFVTVNGSVGGMVMGGANTYDLRETTVAGDAWIGAEKVSIDSTSRINGNATLASRATVVDGDINKDFYGFSESIELSGNVGADLEAFVNRLRLLGDATVTGGLSIRSDNPNVLRQDDGVTIGGETQFLDVPKELEQRSRYATLEFYLWQIVWLVSSFIVAMLLLWLVPSLRQLNLGAGIEAAKTAGVGFLTLISVPVAAVLFAVTLVGLPVSLIAFGSWLLGLYLSQIVLGIVIGSMVMDQVDWRSVLLGLVIVVIGVNVPVIGGVLGFVLTLLGLGLLLRFVIDRFTGRNEAVA